MNRKSLYVALVAVLALMLLGAVVALAQGPTHPLSISRLAALDDGPEETSAPSRAAYTYVSVITVTSGTDPDTSKSATCYGAQAASPCTLRRAIVEARTKGASDLPVLIRFDIPQDSAEGYKASQKVWEIHPQSTSDISVFRRLTAQTIIDGDTQPNGRASGPKIIIVGPTTGQKDGLVVGDFAGEDSIEIYGLAFQNFKTHMTVNTDNNIIEDNWFGLNNAGTAPYVRNDEPEDGSGNTGISFNGDPMDNVVRNNVFLGFDGVAAAIRGEGNLFDNNLVGTRADGSVNKQTSRSLICTTVDWLGGGGISVDGDLHRIENNVFAALRQEIFAISTQPDAIRVSGDDHTVQDNKIGIDGTDTEVGVCGRGIYLGGANSPENTQVLNNTIVNSEMSAISINGVLVDANTLQNNVIKKTSDWPQIEGNPAPEDAIQFGPTVPSALRGFKPARVTLIEGTLVRGASGTNSDCPNCTIEAFLDDTDAITEALQLLGTATANNNGGWSLTLPSELAGGQGIRTTSTSAQFNTIPGLSAGTTTKLSVLYAPETKVFLPLLVR